MKILLISNMYTSEKDPIFGSFIKNIEDGLTKNGAYVDRIVISGRGKNILDKIKKYLTFYLMIIKSNFSDYDIVQISYPTHSFLPIFFKNIKKTKILIRFHGDDLLNERIMNKILSFIRNYAIRKADLIVLPSVYFENEFKKRFGSKKDIFIYPSGGADLEKFYPKDIKKDIFTIGYVGRITEQKGVGILLEAIKYLTFNFKLIIVGDGPELQKYKNEVNQSVLKNKIIFTGAIENEKLVDYYNQFDLFVFPTMRNAESFGNVAIESMACKVPIIGSKIAGLNDYVFDGKNGYFFEPGNSIELYKRIEYYYKLSDIEKKKMQENSFKIVLKYEKNYLNKKFINRLNLLIKQ